MPQRFNNYSTQCSDAKLAANVTAEESFRVVSSDPDGHGRENGTEISNCNQCRLLVTETQMNNSQYQNSCFVRHIDFRLRTR